MRQVSAMNADCVSESLLSVKVLNVFCPEVVKLIGFRDAHKIRSRWGFAYKILCEMILLQSYYRTIKHMETAYTRSEY